MIGNDVVDLRDPDSDERTHPGRFDERVFSSAERSLIRESPEASRLRWWLWSAKEASFKLARKRDPGTVFSPPRFEVEFTACRDAGRVTHRPRSGAPEHFDIRWLLAADAVHAVASEAGRFPAAPALVHGFRRLLPSEAGASGPSRAVRNFARQRLASALAVEEDALEIRSQGRIPVLFLADQLAGADLSLSHHGDWIAFACSIEPTWIAPKLQSPKRAGAYPPRLGSLAQAGRPQDIPARPWAS